MNTHPKLTPRLETEMFSDFSFAFFPFAESVQDCPQCYRLSFFISILLLALLYIIL